MKTFMILCNFVGFLTLLLHGAKVGAAPAPIPLEERDIIGNITDLLLTLLGARLVQNIGVDITVRTLGPIT